MAKNEKPAESMIEDPAKLVKEEEQPKAAKQSAAKAAPATAEAQPAEDKDARIAELERQLAEAQKLNAAYVKGDDYALVQQKCQEAAEQGKDPWSIEVEVRVPARRDCNDPYYWFSVNGRTVQIPANNEIQTMKLPFAETLVNMIRMEKHAQTFADEAVQVYDPKMNPHPEEKIKS